MIGLLKNKFSSEQLLHNTSIIFLFIQLILLAYIFILGWYNPILIDDYCFLSVQRDHGMFGSIKFWYNNWQGRFMPQLFTNVFVWIYQKSGSTILLTSLHFSIFILGAYRIVKNMNFTISKNVLVNRCYILAIILMVFNSTILFNFKPSTFFWVNVSTMYFGGLFFLVLGVGELFYNSNKIISYTLLCFSFFYVGCSSEHVGLITLILLLLLVVFKRLSLLKSMFYNKLFIALVCCLISFLIMLLAPGNEVRRSHFPEPDLIDAFITAKISLKKVIKLIIAKIPQFVAIGFPFLLLGILKRQRPNKVMLLKLVIFSAPLILIMLYVFMLPTAYAISSIGPKRALTYLTGVIIVLVIVSFYFVGFYSRLPKTFGIFTVLLGSLYFGYFTYNTYTISLSDSINFAKNERERSDKLLMFKEIKAKGIIKLDSRNSSKGNIYIDHEISKNPDNWHNECICNALGLGFKIKLN